jgi:uncharacterized membrane protein YgcG
VSLARSRFLSERFSREYAATRARWAISLKAVKHSDDDLWSFIMLPDAPPVSGFSPFLLYSSATRRRGSDISFFPAEGDRERLAVRLAHAPSPSVRARHSGSSRSGRRARRSEGSGGGSTGSRGTRNSGCASSRVSLPRRLRSTRRWERKRGRRATGGRPP